MCALSVPKPNNVESELFSPYDESSNTDDVVDFGPTAEIYGALLHAFSFYNVTFYDEQLPHLVISLQRKKNAYGYFCGDRFADADNPKNIACEIALNPTLMAHRSDEENMSTLLHEMSHHWQYHFSRYPNKIGKRRAYHDREWADDMERMGLIPSDTGKPGGKKTGTRMSHYILDGGPFQKVTRELLATGFTLRWADSQVISKPQGGGAPEPKPKDQSKRKFTCPKCKQNAWAKQTARLSCGRTGCGDQPMLLS